MDVLQTLRDQRYQPRLVPSKTINHNRWKRSFCIHQRKIQEDDVTIWTIYTPNIMAPIFVKEILLKL